MPMWLPVAVATAIAMELWAVVVHGWLWHGVLWPFHKPHHRKEKGLNLNDLLSMSHAPVAILAIVAGYLAEGWGAQVSFGVGIGMTAFGVAYVVVHDGFVHGRLPLSFLRGLPYFEWIRRSHLVHHGNNGPPYGLFFPVGAVRQAGRGDVVQ